MTKTIGARVFHVTVLVLALALALPANGAAILPGYDLLETDAGTTYDDLDLPAGFFGPGSLPFEGRVYFEGVPFDTWDPDGPGPILPVSGLYYTDTIVRRTAAAGPLFPSTIPIEIVELHLKSVSPITVVGGPGAGLWDVYADVYVDPGTGLVFPPQVLGSMTIRHEDANGGTFDSALPVASAATFRRIFPGPSVVGPVVGPALDLRVSEAPWCHTANPLGFPFGHVATDVLTISSNFFASVSCVGATPRRLPVTYSVDGGAFNPLRDGSTPLTPLPNPAEGRFQPVAVHTPPNDVFALGTAPGASGYATEGEVFQSAGSPLGAAPNTTNVDRMSAALGIGPGGPPPFMGPFAPNPGAFPGVPAPPGVLGPPGAFGPPPGNAVGTLGLVPNDNIDGLSYGRDSGNVLYFSVDPASIGVPFSAVRFHAVTSPGPLPLGGPLPTNPGGGDPGDEAAGDVYKSLQLLNFGRYIPLHFANGMFAPPAFLAPNVLVYDEIALGLQAPALNGSALGPPEDDLDGLELADTGHPVFGVDFPAPGVVGPDGIPDRCTFFSIDTASPSNLLFVMPGFISSPDDILVTPPGGFTFGVFADGVAHIGLLPGDDIDALALSDVRGLCTLDPGLDEALFSFRPGSPNVRVGCDGVPASGDEVSPADVFYTNFTIPFCPGPPPPYASAGVLGLLATDDVNAIDILPSFLHPQPGQPPTPPPWPVKKLTPEQAARAAHGIRIAERRRYPHFTVGDFQINSIMFGPIFANVQGPTEVEAESEQVNPDTLNSHIPTEIVLMQLTGNAGPAGFVQITAGRNLVPGLPRTHGQITGNAPGLFFPADSFFDVFFQVDLPALGLQLRNQTPFRVQSSILELPPQGNVYLGNDPVDLFDQFNNFAGQLVFGRHQPRCQADADCNDDGNPCTADTCDIAGGVCVHSPLPDSDGDGVCDDADNCKDLANPGGQAPIAFGQTVTALIDKVSYCWSDPASAEWLQGNLGLVSTYGFDSLNPALGTCFLDGTVPLPGQGLYYLVRHGCPGGSWQNTLGAEPNRDAALP